MEILIGKAGNQPFQITDKEVSRKHAVLRSLSDGTYQLEDAGSTYGTFVNNRKIIKATVDAGTEVRLGSQYVLKISDLLALFEKEKENEKKIEEEKSLIERFNQLKKIYDDYTAEKINLQRNIAMKNFYRTLPSIASTLLFALTMVFSHSKWVSAIRPFLGGLMVIFVGIATFEVYKGQKEQPEKMEELNKQFMIDYVCPQCGNFLGYIPFESLVNKKLCSFCKCKWI